MLLGMLLGVSPIVLAADLETIEARGYLIVGIKGNLRPLGYIDSQGNLAGFEVDIARRLAEALFGDPTAIQLRPLANQERLTAVLDDEVDVAIAALSVTPMRERVLSFTVPYYLDGTGIATNQSNTEVLSDLSGQEIAVLNGSDTSSVLAYRLPDATLVGVNSYQEAYMAIANGHAVAVAGDITILTGWVQMYPDYRLLPEVLTIHPLAIALPKGQQYGSLRRLLNESLLQWHEDGWLEERATYWGLP
jgi:polar amino acid transport system substrate-binding protein